MEKSESIKSVVASLVKFNQEVTKISKDAKNPFLKNNYATLDQIIDQIRPILSAHGLIVTQDISTPETGNVCIKTSVMHESGEYIQSSGITLKLSKNDPQGTGAGVTYGRRYDLSAMLSLNTGDDDDGNSASNVTQNKQQAPRNQAPKPQTPRKDDAPKINMAQKNAIETKAKEFAKLRNQTLAKVMEVLKISDLELITESYANKTIATLDNWLVKASDK